MARFTAWRVGAVVVATGVLVAACSGGGGANSTDDSTAIGAPTGVSGGSSSAHGSKSASKGATKSSSHAATRGASTSAAHSSTPAHHGGGGGGHPTGSVSHSTSASKPPPSNCTSAAPPKPSDPSKAVITVCPARGVHDGTVVTITGDHFKPNEGLLYMQCDYKGENANNYGAADCNINVLEVLSPHCAHNCTKSDASGHVGPLRLTLKEQFKRINCATQACMVTVAAPVQRSDADNPHSLIYFS